MPKKNNEEVKEEKIMRFGESYASLILGVVVVIISTVLLLSFVHNKNKSKTSEKVVQVQQSPTPEATPSAHVTMTSAPTQEMAKKVTPTPEKKIAKGPSVKDKGESKGTYLVKKGDTLWSIAEKTYKSGYNWVDIARVNKLSNPDVIAAGTKLVLPKVEPKTTTLVKAPKATVITPDEQNNTSTRSAQSTMSRKVEQKKLTKGGLQAQKITGREYTVVKGDTLWDISVRAYGDGYRWVKIAKANKLANPYLIHRGNKFTIPR